MYKPYPKYKKSGVAWLGDVPEGWEVSKIKHILEIPITDGPHETPTFIDNGVPFISAEAISKGFIDFNKIRGYISKSTNIKYSKKYSPQLHDIYMIKSGATTGISAIVETNDKFNIWSPLAVFRSKKTINPYFLLNYIRSSNFLEGVELNWSFGTQQNIGMNVLENLYCIVPPLKEQQKIATYLDQKIQKIDTLIAKQQQLIELLKEKRQALVDEALSEVDIQEIQIKRAIHQIHRSVYRDKNEMYTTLGLYNRGRGLFHREPKEEDELGESDFYWVEDGDLILSGQFAWEGAISLAKKSENGCIVSHRFPIIRGKENILNTEYLWAFFTTQLGDFVLNEHSVGSAGRNRPLNMNTLLKEKIPLPSLEAQMKVAKVVKIEQLLHIKIKKEIELLKERRVALVSAVVTGKIDVS